MLNQLYKKPYFPYFILSLLTIFSTIILWLPFIFKVQTINGVSIPNLSFETVLKNWDGPLYIIPAKTNYDIKNQILVDNPMGFEDRYFAAHLPLYPLTLKFIAPLVGYPKSTVLSTLLTTVILVCFFYFFVSKLKLTNNPFLLSIVFLFITPRFFVVRSVGSPEPLFLLLILGSIYFFIKDKYFMAGILGGLAAMTKTPGILLFISYSIVFIQSYLRNYQIKSRWHDRRGSQTARSITSTDWDEGTTESAMIEKIEWRMLWIFLIPAGLLIVFTLYFFQFGDFWAYFHSGDNLHLLFPPFSIFNFQKVWVDTAWLEEIIFIYFLYLLALLKLFPLIHINQPSLYDRKPMVIFTFTLVFFLSIISIQHRDISRYSLPLLPFALITFEEFFTSRRFLIVLVLLLPAIYFYAWNFMLYNVAPIADWTPFL